VGAAFHRRAAGRSSARLLFPAVNETRAVLGRILSPVIALVGVVLLGFLAWKWHESRLPGKYSLMELSPVDYGGGPEAHHAAGHGVSVTQLQGSGPGRPEVRLTLTAEQKMIRLSSGRTVDAWTFNGQMPGPELRVVQGDLVEVTLANKDIEDGVSIHWHGVDVPNGEDGVSGVTQNAVRPGERYTYRFRAEQTGTYWYHSHQNSSSEVRRGLFGPLVVIPREGLPRGTLDLTAMAHNFSGIEALGASDQVQRRTVAPGKPVRLRLVNTNNFSERFVLAGTPFRVLAIDGTDLNEPAPLSGRTLELGAGGRYDLGFTMPRTPATLGITDARIGIVFSPPGSGALPATTSGPNFDPAGYGRRKPTPFDASSHFDRRFVVKIGKRLGFRDGHPGRHWSINGKIYPHTPMLVVRRGDLVRMEIVNDTGSVHPMHLHGQHVLVLSRDGKAVSGSPWWVDTLTMQPHERYDIAFSAQNPGVWMFHCHNLKHAADGLTFHVAYEGVTTPFQVGNSAHNQPE
jgi:FtsP/CotA-like multicopper oxidase with cupredoxin domain